LQCVRIRATLATVENTEIDYTEATVEWEQWAVEDSNCVTGKT